MTEKNKQNTDQLVTTAKSNINNCGKQWAQNNLKNLLKYTVTISGQLGTPTHIRLDCRRTYH